MPFCKSKCPYCDFCSFPHPKAEVVEAYVAELIRRMEAWSKTCTHRTVDTVYFKGNEKGDEVQIIGMERPEEKIKVASPSRCA